MSRGQSPRKTETWKRASEKYKSNGEANEFIDVDSDKIPEVIIIDPPEPSEWTSPDTSTSERGTTPAYKNIIFIDDDDHAENGDSGSSKDGVEMTGNQDFYFTASDESQTSSASPDGHLSRSQFNKSWPAHNKVRKASTSKASRFQGTFSRTASSFNRQNFAPDTSSESDSSDSDILEDCFGNIREQWEKASLRKKACENVPKYQSDSPEEVSYMGNSANSHKDTNADRAAEVPTASANSHKDTNVDRLAKSPTTTSATFHKDTNVDRAAEVSTTTTSANSRKDSNVDGAAEVPTTTSSGHANHETCILSGEGVVSDLADKSYLDDQDDAFEGIGQPIILDRTFCTQVNQMASGSISKTQFVAEPKSQLSVSNCNGCSHVQNYIIGDREMLKQTDAYKRAQEEEWASRQRELEIQAEEAKRLRKRRKAEATRLLEMERRQKQRVDEVRKAQKKDEEVSSLKDKLRVEVRRELDKLEANSRDMASLLRGLGISIDGSVYPFSPQVRVAYKKALLRFHPDRASTSDIRQQIEAEEIFKLITRAKEKFML